MSKHIAILSTILVPGGLDRQLLSLTDYLSGQGHHTDIYSLLPRQQTTMLHESRSLNILYPESYLSSLFPDVLRQSPRLFSRCVSALLQGQSALQEIRRYKRYELDDRVVPRTLFRTLWPKFVENHRANPYATAIGFGYQTIPFLDCIQERLDIPATYCEISSPQWRHHLGISFPDNAQQLRRINRIAVPAVAIGEELRRFVDLDLQYQIVPLYLDMPGLESPLSEEIPNSFGLAARLSPEKNQDKLIHVLHELKHKYGKLDTRLVLAGTGPEESRLRQLAVDLGVANQVVFLGQVEDLRLFYDQIGVIVSLSDVESVSATLLEAIHYGKPVIALNVGANSEIVHTGENGFLLEDSKVDDVARKVCEILSSRDLYRAMSKEGRKISDSLQVAARSGLSELIR